MFIKKTTSFWCGLFISLTTLTAFSGKDQVAGDNALLYRQISSASKTCEKTISNKFKPSLLEDFPLLRNSSPEFESFQDIELLQKWFQDGKKPENISEGFMFAIIKHFSPLGMSMQEVYGKGVAVFGTNPKDGATYHELSEIFRQNEPVVLHLIGENIKQISESIRNANSDNIQYIAYPYFYKGKTAPCFAFFVPTDKFCVKNEGDKEAIEYLFIPIFFVKGKFHIGSIYCLSKKNHDEKIELAKKKARENSPTIFGIFGGNHENVGELLSLKDEKREQEEQVKNLKEQIEAPNKRLQQKSEEFSEQKQKSKQEKKELKREIFVLKEKTDQQGKKISELEEKEQKNQAPLSPLPIKKKITVDGERSEVSIPSPQEESCDQTLPSTNDDKTAKTKDTVSQKTSQKTVSNKKTHPAKTTQIPVKNVAKTTLDKPIEQTNSCKNIAKGKQQPASQSSDSQTGKKRKDQKKEQGELGDDDIAFLQECVEKKGQEKKNLEEIFKKIEEGKVDEVKKFLENKENSLLIYYKDEQENTLLHCACENNLIDIVKLLLQIDTNTKMLGEKNGAQLTPLLLAIIKSRKETVEFLLNYSKQKIKKFDINQRFDVFDIIKQEQKKITVTPLLLAVMHNQAENADILIANGAMTISEKGKPEALLYAIEEGNLELVKSLLPSFHTSIQKEFSLSLENSPIASAIKEKQEDILRYFFKKENISKSGHELKKLQYSCLECTLFYGDIEITNKLLNYKYGADEDGKLSSKWQELAEVKDLVSGTALTDKWDRRCLHITAFIQDIPFALLEMQLNEFDPDKTDIFGISPLMLAFSKKDIRMIKMLLAARDENIHKKLKDIDCGQKKELILQALDSVLENVEWKKLPANLLPKNKDETPGKTWTVLDFAARFSDLEIVNTLEELGFKHGNYFIQQLLFNA